jgi:hypothetical protein
MTPLKLDTTLNVSLGQWTTLAPPTAQQPADRRAHLVHLQSSPSKRIGTGDVQRDAGLSIQPAGGGSLAGDHRGHRDAGVCLARAQCDARQRAAELGVCLSQEQTIPGSIDRPGGSTLPFGVIGDR